MSIVELLTSLLNPKQVMEQWWSDFPNAYKPAIAMLAGCLSKAEAMHLSGLEEAHSAALEEVVRQWAFEARQHITQSAGKKPMARHLQGIWSEVTCPCGAKCSTKQGFDVWNSWLREHLDHSDGTELIDNSLRVKLELSSAEPEVES